MSYLTDKEQRIWEATYAAYFVANKGRWACELAVEMADLAVSSLREFRDNTEPLAGLALK